MTATPAVESVVTVEHDGNVTFLTWHRTEPPPRPPVRHEPLAVGGGSTCRRVNFRGAWGRSQLRRDLIEWAWLIGLLAAAVVGFVIHDHLSQLAHALIGALTR